MNNETNSLADGVAHAAPDVDGISALPYATESTPVAGTSYHAAMTRGDVAVLALRLLGVFAIIQGSAFLSVLGSAFTGLGSGVADWGRTLAVMAPYGIYLGLGIVLVATAGWIGPKLLPDARRSDEAAGRASARDIQAVAFSVVGVVVAVWSLGELASAIWYLSFRSGRANEDRTAWDMASPHLVRFAVQVGVGVVLFLGAKGLTTLWRRLREPNPLRDAADDVPEAAERPTPDAGPGEQTHRA